MKLVVLTVHDDHGTDFAWVGLRADSVETENGQLRISVTEAEARKFSDLLADSMVEPEEVEEL